MSELFVWYRSILNHNLLPAVTELPLVKSSIHPCDRTIRPHSQNRETHEPQVLSCAGIAEDLLC
jgi:hypothetical protein